MSYRCDSCDEKTDRNNQCACDRQEELNDHVQELEAEADALKEVIKTYRQLLAISYWANRKLKKENKDLDDKLEDARYDAMGEDL